MVSSAAVDDLDKEKPHQFFLLGMPIVIWFDGKPADGVGKFESKKNRKSKKVDRVGGEWRAFVDECSHRKVPLSEGRVEDDGSLLCSYHGWRFNGDGNVIDVPQVDEDEMAKIRANPKSNCNKFPAQLIDGILWVWADNGKDASLEAALTAPPVIPRPPGAEELVKELPWNWRELPYSHDYFIENVVDPAHVTISHHGIVGDRYDDQSLQVEVVDSLSKTGFSILAHTNMNEKPTTTTFTAPSSVDISAPFGDGGCSQLQLYVSPSRPGFCNHIGRQVIVKDSSGVLPQFLKQFAVPMPRWLQHLVSSVFLNQDGLFLHKQERHLASTGQYSTMKPGCEEKSDFSKLVCATSTDLGVMNFRKWMSVMAGGHIPYKYGDLTVPPTSNDVVYDVWNAHTKNCKTCLDALKNLKKARFAAFATSAFVGLARPFGVVKSIVSSIVLAAVGLLMNKVMGLFFKYETSHADNN
eukprot:CAMPEP_0116013938 /NCGR_PEP_ID=MMETSP0321-20121206/6005_1 /TAXON_ID=163516 /ORGANISM="Leptocylindrus danicus var. danicus, Strain B650" /LENGTH=466 /DNA_ID=CAMNT_0003483545 /DNA_START=271 /DNA_END=1672 /DNA_ORIENTATION=-